MLGQCESNYLSLLLFVIVHFATVAFRMLFMLPCDCSASGMFAVHNVMSYPALVRKLVFGFYKRVKASQNAIVQDIMCI